MTDNQPDERARQVLADMMSEFVSSTIVGHERGIYRYFKHCNMPLEKLHRSDCFARLLAGATINYFNLAYKSLIRRDDLYVCTAFDRMHRVAQHSYVCLLNVLLTVTINLHSSIDRSALDVTNLEAYQASIESALQPTLDAVRQCIADHFAHDCHGEDIAHCDPNVDMFTLDSTMMTTATAAVN